jgi:hypothetical protein
LAQDAAILASVTDSGSPLTRKEYVLTRKIVFVSSNYRHLLLDNVNEPMYLQVSASERLNLPARWIDPQKSVGDLQPGQDPFGSQETIIEFGLPFSRRYDVQAELWRIRHIWRAEAAGARARPTRSAGFKHHSLRRG